MRVGEVHGDVYCLRTSFRIDVGGLTPIAGEGGRQSRDFNAPDDISIRPAFSTISGIDTALGSCVTGRVVAGVAITTLEVRGFNDLRPAGSNTAGRIESRDECIVLHERVKGEGLASARDGMRAVFFLSRSNSDIDKSAFHFC